jgi:hypothetical protein
MMQIVYFSQKQQFLKEIEHQQGEMVFVTPSPSKADGLRSRLTGSRGIDVVTIAKFTSNLIEALWPRDNRPQVKRKSELLLIFGILKNRILPELEFEQFNQAYNLFSDLRSFTLHQDILSSVLDEQPEIIKRAVLMFWELLEKLGYQDEHGAYQMVAERLRTQDENEDLNKTYIFWGFQHLNGQQIDLLKALSIRYKVIIPFPIQLREKIKKSDWISWIKDSVTIERELELIQTSPRVSWLPTNSREISLELKKLMEPEIQIVLGVSKLDQSHLDLVPSNLVKFKIPHQILKTELIEVGEELKLFSGNHLDLSFFCEDKIKTSKSPKKIKSWQLYLEALNFVSEFTDPIPMDRFLQKVLAEVVSLNQPRTSFVPVSEKELSIDLKDMSSLEYLDRRRKVIVCIDERFNEIQSLGQPYTESIHKALTAIGPIKRNELELLFKQWEFRDLLSHSDVMVLMNEGILKHSLIWKRMFSDVEILKLEKSNQELPRVMKDYLTSSINKKFQGSYSASKLQSYIDCPRKFYFNYVDKIFPNVLLEKDFDPMISGSILHEIIETFFKENWVDKDFSQLTDRIVHKYISERKLQLSIEILRERTLTFNHRAWNGIQFIRNLEILTGEQIEWKFEEPFEQSDPIIIKGRIDCVGLSASHVFLLDFKSTEMSASSASEVVEFQAIQLWVYADAARNSMKEFGQKSIIMGYVVLDDSSKSGLLTSDEEFFSKLKSDRLCKIHKFKEEFTHKFQDYVKTLRGLKDSIEGETLFPPRPRKASACTYCEINKICVKSEMSHE